jgi:tetratricopeptide (TPR) repeat protein
MKLAKTVALLFLLAAPPSLYACLNTYGTDLRGESIEYEFQTGEELIAELRSVEPRQHWVEMERRLETAGDADFHARNDLAVALVHLGRLPEAVAILTQIARDHPGEYVVAANLGTAYELAGNDAEALRWIRRGIALNSKAHEGSEWLHARILEAKLALRDDPHWLETHGILGIDFGNGVIPKRASSFPPDNIGKPTTIEDVREALLYQLHERYAFVKTPEPIVGSLLFEWANLAMRDEVLEAAAPLYREALRFGTPHRDLARRRLHRVEQVLRDAKLRQ